MTTTYVHHRVATQPRSWRDVSQSIQRMQSDLQHVGGQLYGIWRSQIGRPRDELNVITHWPASEFDRAAFEDGLASIEGVIDQDSWLMLPTLRPVSGESPSRQGNYAFRLFRTPEQNWDEFLQLCAEAWPGFESSYVDCQVIGLWRYARLEDDQVNSLLLTRRPDLANWERTKLPQGAVEEDVRLKLSRRYDLCDSTYVFTSTLLTAADRRDDARWT